MTPQLLTGVDALAANADLDPALGQDRLVKRFRHEDSTGAFEGGLPSVAQATPARHSTATAHLLRKHLPRNAAFEDKQNAG